MEAKAKKPSLKQTNPYKYYKNAYVACEAGEWSCLVAPVVGVFGAKWQEYFDFTEEANGSGVKMTIGCVLALVVAAIILLKRVKQEEKVNDKLTMLPYVLGIGVAFVLSYLCKVVVDDLFLILGCEFAGSVAAYGVDFATLSNKSKMQLYKDALDKLHAEEAAKAVVDSEKGEKDTQSYV